MLFANLAESVAEGRGKAQAASLRKTRTSTTARRVDAYDATADAAAERAATVEVVLGRPAASATSCVVTAGELIPGDGDIVWGIATVDESAITGESAPVVRESGGDRSAVTGGTRVLSDRIVVQHHLEARRDLRRPHDRARRGRVPPEDAERDRARTSCSRACRSSSSSSC